MVSGRGKTCIEEVMVKGGYWYLGKKECVFSWGRMTKVKIGCVLHFILEKLTIGV